MLLFISLFAIAILCVSADEFNYGEGNEELPMPAPKQTKRSRAFRKAHKAGLERVGTLDPDSVTDADEKPKKGFLNGMKMKKIETGGKAMKKKNRIVVAAKGAKKDDSAGNKLPAREGVDGKMSAAAAKKHSAAGVAKRRAEVLGNEKEKIVYKVAEEEAKVRLTTLKLVKWLRNRLRSRLDDIGESETEMDSGARLIQDLAEKKKHMAGQRSAEIKAKLESQKRLAEYRRTLEEPDGQLRVVESQTKKLSSQLDQLKKTYNSLAAVHTKLRQQLRTAGFSHWLDTRGKEYLPPTAVGVLSKSAEILDPIAHGLERAVDIDRSLSLDLEEMVPPLSDAHIFSAVLADVLVLLPLIPIFFLALRIWQTLHTLSVLHILFYGAAVFAAQTTICLLVSFYTGHEALRYFQVSNEPVLIAGTFLNALLFTCFIFLLAIVALLRRRRTDVAQVGASMLVGWHFYQAVLRPAVMDEAITYPAPSYLLYVAYFTIVMVDKNKTLQMRYPYEEHIDTVTNTLKDWGDETMRAIRAVFDDEEVECSGRADAAETEWGKSERDGSEHDATQHDSHVWDEERGWVRVGWPHSRTSQWVHDQRNRHGYGSHWQQRQPPQVPQHRGAVVLHLSSSRHRGPVSRADGSNASMASCL